MYKIPCSKCEGKGTIQGFAMVAAGVCFQCKGSGYKKGNKAEYERYLESKERQEKKAKLDSEKVKLENYFFDNLKHLIKNIEMVITIKQTEDIENDQEAKFVYDRQKGKIKEFVTQYKKYKLTYNKMNKDVEETLKKYNIKCV